MNIGWAVAHNFKSTDTLSIDEIKNIGPTWGGVSTWKDCQTDNVVSNDFEESWQLLNRKFNLDCNFWINQQFYGRLESPGDINIFNFESFLELDHSEDIIILDLAANKYDLVLAIGYNLSLTPLQSNNSDDKTDPRIRIAKHKNQNYLQLIVKTIKKYPNAQFVFIDVDKELDTALPNCTYDSIDSVAFLQQIITEETQ